MSYMKRVLFLFVLLFVSAGHAEFTCGPGYVLAKHSDIDGIDAVECQKLWCMDLETGKMMGRAGAVYAGYKATSGVQMLEVSKKDPVYCWGTRKWCAGQPEGRWDMDSGRYVRTSADDAYESYLNGSCFSWRLKDNPCSSGQDAKLVDGVWECMEKEISEKQIRGSAIRRTSAPRRILR